MIEPTMKDRIGMSSPSLNVKPFEQVAVKVAKEFRRWEIVLDGDYHLDFIERRLETVAISTGLRLQFHAPFSDVNVASVNRRSLELSLDQTRQAIEVAGRLDMGPVTVHPGFLSPFTSQFPEKAAAIARSSMKAISKMAVENSVAVGIENMPRAGLVWKLFYAPHEMVQLLDGTDLGVTMDFGHANTSGSGVKDFKVLRDRIVNVHIHDNDGTGDRHAVLGTGKLDLEAISGLMSGYNGPWIIEGQDLSGAVSSRPVLESILKNI